MRKLALIGLVLLISVNCQFLSNNANESGSLSKNNFRLLQDIVFIMPSKVGFKAQSYLTFSGFSTTTNISKIELVSDLTTVQLQILQTTNTSITCKYDGGLKGIFNGRITLTDGSSYKTSSTVTFNTIVNTVSPQIGSYKGGVLVTIAGSGFSNVISENQVLMGSTPCKVVSAVDYQIVCVTQPALNSLNQKVQTVVQFGNLVSDFSNASTSSYSFISVLLQPTITKISSNYGSKFIKGDAVTVEGSNLFDPQNPTLLYIGDRSISYQKTTTGLTFVIPQDLSREAQQLVIYAGSYGSTQPQSFQLGAVITKIYGLNSDDNNLTIQKYQMLYFAAQIMGISANSQVSIQYDQGINNFATSVITKFGVLLSNYQDSNTSPTQITQINVDGQNILPNPINLDMNYNSSYLSLQFSITLDPKDNTNFIMTLNPNSDFPDIVINDIIMIDSFSNTMTSLVQSQSNQFQTKRLDFQTQLQFYAFTNKGPALYYPQSNLFFLPVPQITKITPDGPVSTGDILQFTIASPNWYKYSMNVVCLNSKNSTLPSKPARLLQSTPVDLSNYDPTFSDSYQVFPSLVNGNTYSFKFPTILSRPFSPKKTCDIIIASNNPDQIAISQYTDENNQENSQFVNRFLDQAANPAPSNEANTYSIGTVQLYNGLFLALFSDSVTPTKQNIYVLSITPQYLSPYGGENVVITGNNFLANNNNISTTSVTISGVVCQVQSVTSTQIVCVSGQNTTYDPRNTKPAQILIGKQTAFLFTHANYVYDSTESVQMKNYYEKLQNSQNINVPRYLGLTLNIGKAYTGNTVSINNINVDGQLFFDTSVDLSVQINQINGLGLYSIGKENKEILSNLQVQINQVNVYNLSSFGKKIPQYSYKLKSSFAQSSTIIQVQDSQVYLQKGSKITVLATSLDEQNESFIVDSVNGNQITVTSPAQGNHQNTVESHAQKNGSVQQFTIEVPILSMDRNIQLTINNVSFYSQLDKLYDSSLQISQVLHINSSINSIIKISQKLNLNLRPDFSAQNIQSSVIQAFDGLDFAIQTIQKSFIIASQSQKYIKTNPTLFTNNFVQTGIYITRNVIYQTSQTPASQIISNNLIVSTQVCFTEIIEPSSNLTMDSNICFSSVAFTGQLSPKNINTSGLALIGLDIRTSLFANIPDELAYYVGLNYILPTESFPSTKFFIVANTLSNPTKNTPNLVQLQQQERLINQIKLQQYEIQGFNNAPQGQSISMQNFNGVAVVDVYNIKSDVSQNASLYNDALFYQQGQALIVIDRDGSLTGKQQNLVSSNLVRPQLACTQNQFSQMTCTKQLAVGQINTIAYNPDAHCTLYSQAYAFVDSQVFNYNGYFPSPLNEITEFRMVDYNDNTKDVALCYFEYTSYFIQDMNQSYAIKYKIDTTKFNVKLTLSIPYVQSSFYPPVPSIDLSTCQHGQYSILSDGVVICIKSINGGISNLGINVVAK